MIAGGDRMSAAPAPMPDSVRPAPERAWRHGVLALLVGVAALAVPPHPFAGPPTWETLLAPWSTGAPLPGGFRVEDIRRGAQNAVVVSVRRPDDGAAVEVVVVARGRWKSKYGSRSFTIDYEVPDSPAAERDAVTTLLAGTIGARDRGLPSPDAIPLRAGDASVLPWSLELVRGVRGTLIGASAVVLALLWLDGSPALAWLGVALGVVDVIVRVVGVPVLRTDLGGLWTLAASAALLVVALRGRWSRAGVLPVAVLAVTALVLRLDFGPWGPLHVNGQGARFVAGAAGDGADIAAYGPGYREMFAPVAGLAPGSPDRAIFACNAVLSALLPPLAFGLARLTGVAAGAAFLAGMLLAIDPVAIRMGTTESYFPAIALLCTGASVILLLALRQEARRRAAALVVAGGLLLSAAARIHPCAWVVMATVPFAVIAGDGGDWRRRVRMLIVAAMVAGGLLVFTSGSGVLDVVGNIRSGTVFRPRPPSLGPLAVIAAVAALYAVVTPRPALAVPAGIALAAMVLTRQGFDASAIWEQSYFRLYLTIPVVAAVACVPPALLRRPSFVVAATAAVAVVWLRFGLPIVAARTVEHREYRWARAQLVRIPPACRVVHVGAAGKRVLTLPTYVGAPRPAVAMDLRQQRTVDAALAPAPCLYYVHTSLCSTPDGRPDCETIERRLTLVPIARAAFAGGREWETFSHDRDPVKVTIARVERVDAR